MRARKIILHFGCTNIIFAEFNIRLNNTRVNPESDTSVGEPEPGAETFYWKLGPGPWPVKIIWEAGAVKPYLVGAGKISLKTAARCRCKEAESWTFLKAGILFFYKNLF